MIHQLPSKAALARHLCWPQGPLLMDPKEVAGWTKEELEAEHERVHEESKKQEQSEGVKA